MSEESGENTVIEYSMDTSRQDVRKAMAEFSLQMPLNKKPIRRVRIIYIICAVIFLAVAVVDLITRRVINITMLFGFVLFLAFALSFRAIRKHQLLRQMRTTLPSHTVRYSWSEEELRTVSPVRESHIRWELFDSVFEDENFIMVCGTNMQAAVCDKKSLSPEELGALRELIARKMQKNQPAS